jgi:hypothetical protein
MASLVEQIMLQSQAGSANGAGFGDYFFKGKQLSQQQQQIDMQKQELAANLAMMPLKQTLMQQDAKLNEFQLQDRLQSRQNYLDSTGAFTNLTARLSPLLNEGKLEEAQKEAVSAGLSNSFLLTDPRYKSLTGQLDSMRKEADLAQYRMMQAEAAQARAEAAKASTELAASRIELGKTNADLRAQELNLRINEAKKRMPANRRALLEAKMQAVGGDVTLTGSRDEKLKLLEEIAKEFEQPDVSPGASLAPASTNAFKDAGNGFKFRVTKP